MKSIIMFFFVVVNTYFTFSQSVNAFQINTIRLDKDSTIKFPHISGCIASDSINLALYRVLQSYFPCQGVKSVVDCLAKAESIDLDKLDYSTYNSDSTVSFVIKIILRKHNIKRTFKRFLTFSLKTGQRLKIQDIFPGFTDVDFYNFFVRYNAFVHEREINKHLAEFVKTNNISKLELDILENRLKYNECREYFDEFVLARGRLLFKSYYIIPNELDRFIPDSFVINAEYIRSQLTMYAKQLE